MKTIYAIIFVVTLALILTGCTGVTGNAARPPPPAQSGGGCGVAAPADEISVPLTNTLANTGFKAPAF